VKRTLKTDDKELARRRLEGLRREVARLSTRPDAAALLFSDVAKNWLELAGTTLKPSSRRRRETAIGQLKRYFPKPVRNVVRADVEHWATDRTRSTSARTFNIERETLIQILDYAGANGLLLDNPVVAELGSGLNIQDCS
jgi:hypothetical protein